MIDKNITSCKKNMIQKDNMQKNGNTDTDLYLSNYPIHCNLGLLSADQYGWPELLTWLVTCDDKAYQ